MSESQTSRPLWMSGTPADDHPMVLAVSKRIRAFRKKLDKIEKTESLSSNQISKALTEDQKQLLASKASVIAILQELEKLRETQIQIVMDASKNEQSEVSDREESRRDGICGEEATPPSGTEAAVVESEPLESECKGSLPESKQTLQQSIVSRDLLSLFFTARLLDTKLQPNMGGFRESVKETDRLALQYLTVLVEGSGRAFPVESSLAQRVDECELHAEKYLSRSDDVFMPGYSYHYIHQLVDGFLALTPVQSPTSINFLVPSLVGNVDSNPY